MKKVLLSVFVVACVGCGSGESNPNRDVWGNYQPANKYELSKDEYNALMDAAGK